MSRALPKVESREFEIADSQPTPAPLGAHRTPPFELWIRIWNKGPRGFEAADISNMAETVFVQMVSDLMVAGSGGIEPRNDAALMARFPSLGTAITIAKRVHRCVVSFAAKTDETGSVGIAISASRLTTTGDRLPAKTLLDLARPGTIVLAEDVWRELELVPGLRLLRLSEDSAFGTADPRVRELVWTPVPDNSDPLWAQVHGERLKLRRLADSPLSSDSRTKVFEARISRVSVNEDEPALPASKWIGGLHRKHVPVLVGVAVVISLTLVLSALLLLSKLRHRHEPTPGIGATESVSQPNPSTQGQDSGFGGTDAKTKKDESSEQKPLISTSPDKKIHGKNQDHANTKTQGTKATDQNRQPCQDFSATDIQGLLARGNQELGAGEYSRARYAFGVVLCLDPKNPQANDGLRRVRLSERERE